MTTIPSEDAPAKGRELYHAIWLTVKEKFFDVNRLVEWDAYEHSFDGVIDSEESALRCASQALATLNDSFTTLVLDEAPEAPFTYGDSANEADRVPNVTAVVSASGIGYLRVMSFSVPGVADEVEAGLAKIAHCKGLILDLRHNVGGLLYDTMDIAELFLHDGVIAILETRTEGGIKRRKIVLKPDCCEWTEEMPDGQTSTETYKRRKQLVAGKPIAVLIGSRTASASELLAAALVLYGYPGLTVSVGKTTVGKGIAQEITDILGKVKLKITVSRYLVGTGDWLGDCGQTFVSGMEPMIEVSNDTGIEGLEKAKDELKAMIAASSPQAV